MRKIKLFNKILDSIYPPVCGICGKLDHNGICNKCKNTLLKQSVFKIDDYSIDDEKYFDKHIYFFIYDGIIRKMLLQYKFQEKSYIHKTFVNFIKNNKKICAFLKNYDIIVPVPISKKRLKSRGYNQSALLAMVLAKELELEYDDRTLVKIKEIQPQSTLKKEDRTKNVQNVYSIKNNQVFENRKILLVDDIYTTGSTVNECSKILSNTGALEIGILTIAKD